MGFAVQHTNNAAIAGFAKSRGARYWLIISRKWRGIGVKI
jgi:hypothetical protein